MSGCFSDLNSIKNFPPLLFRSNTLRRPESPGLGNFSQIAQKFPQVVAATRHVIRVRPSPEHIPGEDPGYCLQGQYALGRGGIEPGPVADVLFRPEEVHGASGKGQARQPLGEGHRHVSHDTCRFGFGYRAILHGHLQRFAAVQAGGVNLHGMPRKQPANCQRFEPSLGKPLRLARHSEPVLGRQITEGGEAADIIGLGKEP
jgi:hypothetical protein